MRALNFCLVIYLATISALLARNFHPFVITCMTACGDDELSDKKIVSSRAHVH